MSGSDDRKFRDVFQTLRDDEAQGGPHFSRMIAGTRRLESRGRRRRGGGLAAVALAASLAVFATSRSTEQRPTPGDLGAELIATRGVWRAPTDFLLEDRPSPLWKSTKGLREILSPVRNPQ